MRSFKGLAMIAAAALLITACSPAGPAGSPGQSQVAGATTRCNDINQDLTKTTVGPNGEASTGTTDIPDLTDAQKEQVVNAHYKWAYLPSGTSTWFSAVESGAKDEAADLGMDLTVTADSNFDPAKQAADVETAMASDPDVILTLPVDPTSAGEAFRPAVDKGVKLVFNDNGIDGYTAGNEYVAIVTGDHFGMGEAAADLMNQALGDAGGNIGFIFHDAQFYVTNNRDCRFLAKIAASYPNIHVVAQAGFTEEPATEEIASAMVAQHPDIKAIYVAWSAAATGVLAALRAAGREDIKVVAHDLDASNDVDMASGGNLFGVAADKPYLIGRTQVKLAALALLGQQVPGFVTVPVVTETKDTITEAWHDSLNLDPPQEVLDALNQ